jgi:long-chain acyl-CoA synthetase
LISSFDFWRFTVAEFDWFKHYPAAVPRTVEVPCPPIYSLLEKTASAHADRPALDFMGYTMSYGELGAAVNRLAAALRDLGVRKGDRVALMLPNLPQMVIGFFAVNRAGAVIVNVNPLYTARELRGQLQDSGAETLILLDRFMPVYDEVAGEVPVKRVIVTGVQDFLPAPKNLLYPLLARAKREWVTVKPAAHVHPFKRLLAGAAARGEPPQVQADDLALLQYTGGTTGAPKAAMLSNRNIVANVTMLRAWNSELREAQETFLLVIPFFHVYGMSVGLGLAVESAAKMILLPRFETKAVLAAIHKHKPTIFPGVPTMYVAINNFPGVASYDLTSIRSCISGAAALPREVKERFEALSGAQLVEGYGLTEASPVTHSNPLTGRSVTGSIGLPLPNVEAKIVDAEGDELPHGEVGELVVRGPNVMMGYWGRPEETAATMRGGWLYTGDMATRDEDGYFYIRDRKKDLIICGGFNVYPREVEEVLYGHPAVQEAAVIGVPDLYRGETVKAFVVKKAAAAVTEEELIAFCRESLAAFKVPKFVEFRDSLPKTLIGKILRRRLAEEEKERAKSLPA